MGLADVSLGVDFDNTLICYDGLFHRAAVERGLVPPTLKATKESVRNHLRGCGRETDWTELQGAVYGSRIHEAPPFPGALETLRGLLEAGATVAIVSHKTRRPILGATSDLHEAALSWLELNGVFGSVGLERGRVFFEETREGKLARIGALCCTHFLDDLLEVLKAPCFPRGAVPLFFAPSEPSSGTCPDGLTRIRAWSELEANLFASRGRPRSPRGARA